MTLANVDEMAILMVSSSFAGIVDIMAVGKRMLGRTAIAAKVPDDGTALLERNVQHAAAPSSDVL